MHYAPIMKCLLPVFFLSATALLASCGGGGGGDSTVEVSSTPPSSTPPSSTPPSSTPPSSTPLSSTPPSGPNVNSSGTLVTGDIDGYPYEIMYNLDGYMDLVLNGSVNLDFYENNDEFNSRKEGRSPFGEDNDIETLGTVTYYNENGFHGFYNLHEGSKGSIISDVRVQLEFSNSDSSTNVGFVKIGENNPIIIEGENFGSIAFGVPIDVGLGFDIGGPMDVADNGSFSSFVSTHEKFGDTTFVVLYGIFSDQTVHIPDGSSLYLIPSKVAGHIGVEWDRDPETIIYRNSLWGYYVADVEE